MGQIALANWISSQGALWSQRANYVDALTAFGLFAVTAMMACYSLERRSRWFIFGFALACILGSIYGFLQGAWPFGVIEAVWAVVAFARFSKA